MILTMAPFPSPVALMSKPHIQERRLLAAAVVSAARLRSHGPDSHLLPHHRHRPLDRLLWGIGIRGDRAHPDSRRGRERVHEPTRRRRYAAPRADPQLRRGL